MMNTFKVGRILSPLLYRRVVRWELWTAGVVLLERFFISTFWFYPETKIFVSYRKWNLCCLLERKNSQFVS